ncbi:MAG: 2OG-Fe(II) oxygenase [Acidimicrobiia bacterium]
MAVDFDRLEREQDKLHAEYVEGKPFPNIVIDDLLLPDVIDQAVADFPGRHSERWLSYSHVNEYKFTDKAVTEWSPTLQEVLADLHSDRFVKFLETLTGIQDLFIDESLECGGLHQSVAGGFLNVHADFTVHPLHRSWARRVNILLYLNEDWDDAWGGQLELWSKDMKRYERKVSPLRNRAAIFSTDKDSFHGHPQPLACPPERARQSMALYYFTEEDDPYVRSTEYRATPGTGWRSSLIYVDKQALRGYDWVKRRLNFNDDTMNKMQAWVSRFRGRKDG